MNKRISAGFAALIIFLSIAPVSAENTPTDEKAVKAAVSVSDDTEYVYNIASVSKVYTTAAVMQLADEGKIDIDRPVTDYLPGFSLADERYRDITARMLMDHTSGIMGSTRTNEGFFDDNDRFHHDTLLEYLSAQRLKADPGKYAAYCNDGFDLLELIIENVSGMSYTEYIKANIADRVGAVSTGTGVDMLGIPTMVPAVLPNGLHYETSYLMDSGTGGVYATASDVALFGASFFTGNDSVLSENSKNAMGMRWNDNEYSDDNGLGWDFTDLPRYEKYGIKTLHKGGDGSSDHAWLLSAPDEQISVAVLSGNGSSTYNGMVASALLDAALSEKSIIIEDAPLPECEIVNNIPDEYTKFAGWYGMDIESQDSLCSISFQDNKYLHMERTNHRRTECTDYVLTADGDFAELEYEVSETINADGSFDMRLAAGGSSRISFEENADRIYIKMACINSYPGLGSYENKTYIGQKIEENNVSEDVINTYRELSGHDLLLCSDKYSSTNYYAAGISRLYVCDKLKGYVFVSCGGLDNFLKITDSGQLTSFCDIPSSGSRDIWDATIERDGDGTALLKISNGLQFFTDNNIPVFDASVKNVEVTDGAAWYHISDSIANTSIRVTRPENSAVYVYNKFGEVIYTTYVKDASPYIPMPKGGKILFLGQEGGRFDIAV